MAGKFIIKRSSNWKYHFNLHAASSEMYEIKASANKDIAAARANAPTAHASAVPRAPGERDRHRERRNDPMRKGRGTPVTRWRTRAMLLVAAAIVFSPTSAWAHGYTTAPVSRAVWCQRGQVGDCGGVQWEPQSIEGPKNFPDNGPPDGQICSAGNQRWKALDGLTAPDGDPWPMTTLNSDTDYTFTWHLTKPHRTTYFREFITTSQWQPGQPITRAALEPEPIATDTWDGNTPGPDVEYSGRLPDRSGPAVIVSVWDVADTSNAFYQCADVFFV